MAGYLECDCGARYKTHAALMACQNNRHGAPPVSWEDRNVKLYSQTELEQAVGQEREACAQLMDEMVGGVYAESIRNRTD